jgi:hypothetical protein
MSTQAWRIRSASQSQLLHNITTIELEHDVHGKALAMVAYAMKQPFVDHIEANGKVATKDCLLWLESELAGGGGGL